MLNPFGKAVATAVGTTPAKLFALAPIVNGVPALILSAESTLLNRPVNDTGYSEPNNPVRSAFVIFAI